MILNKEGLKAAIRKDIAKTIAPSVFAKYPNAISVYFYCTTEEYETDREYYGARLSVILDGFTDAYQMWDIEEGSTEEEEVCDFIASVVNLVNEQDFVFAYGFNAEIDLKPYRGVEI